MYVYIYIYIQIIIKTVCILIMYSHNSQFTSAHTIAIVDAFTLHYIQSLINSESLLLPSNQIIDPTYYIDVCILHT